MDGVCPVCVAKVAPQDTEPTPRVSRMAIAGAVWAGTVLFLYYPVVFALFILMMKYKLFAGNAPVPLWGYPLLALFVVLAPVAGLSPIGVPLLGWLSASKIRSSEGKLRGLFWAVFDCLWFPLLIVGGGIALGIPLLIEELIPNLSSAFFLLSFPLAALADYFIIRRVWRMMKIPKRSKSEVAEVSQAQVQQAVFGTEDKKAVLWATALHMAFLLLLFGSGLVTVLAMKP